MADDYDPHDAPTFDAAIDDTEQHQPQDISDLAPPVAPPNATSRTGSVQPTRPATQAGFIVDSSDDEEDDVQVNGVDGSIDPEPPTGDIPIDSMPPQETTSEVPSVQQISPSDAASLNPPAPVSVSPAPASAIPSTSQPAVNTIAQPNGTAPRLAHDKVGQLEDRISDEPRADPSAWLSLIQYYKEKDQLDNARKTYDRFLEVYPTAASIWLDYLNFEQEQDDPARIDQLLGRALLKTPNVDLCLFYINVLRRRHPLINDTDGKNRAVITQAFDFVLDHVGIDFEAGRLWREYIEFVKSGPGTVSATSNHWQDQQKADLLRKAYHRAVALPNNELIKLWKDYDNFELTFSRAAGRKFLTERSPHYMTAKAAKTQLDERVIGLDRTSLPKLPPLPGFSGDVEFATQIQKWRDWIEWEKSDELVLKQDDDVEGYRKRIHYAYKQATMAMRFYPDLWFEAAGWCIEQGTEHWKREGETFLDAGITANPESSLLALRKADLVEQSFRGKGDTDEVVISNGQKLEAIYERAHTALYGLKTKYKTREEKALADLQTHYDSLPPEDEEALAPPQDDEDEEDKLARPKTREQQKQESMISVKASTAALQDILKRTISFVWVAKMRAFRRVQGQGNPKDLEGKKGFRGVFSEARPRGSLTSDVYIASALIEHHCFGEIAATRIFERGLKLFPTDELFILEYMKHLISKNDHTNAKAVFETSITKIEKSDSFTREQKQEKCRPLLMYMYQFESNYGDLVAIHRLGKRIADMYPQEPEISRFAERFKLPSFDATRSLLAISPVQTQPKAALLIADPQPIPSIENVRGSPQPGQILLGPHGPYVASPKRPLEDSDTDTPSRKFLRGESPLKGAAGRRIATASGAAAAAAAAASVVTNPGGGGFVTKSYVPGQAPAAPQALAVPLQYILSILPNAASYQATRLDASQMVSLIRSVDLTRARI